MSGPKNNGGPAYPEHYTDGDGFLCAVRGMSMRDWFAGQALVGLLSAPIGKVELREHAGTRTGRSAEYVAALAYGFADAMLKERDK